VGAVVMLVKHDTVETGFQGVGVSFELLVVKSVSLLGFEMGVWPQEHRISQATRHVLRIRGMSRLVDKEYFFDHAGHAYRRALRPVFRKTRLF